MLMTLHVPGATPERLEAGLAAAQAVFDIAGVTAVQAALAHWEHRRWQEAGGAVAKPTKGTLETAAVYRLAQLAAIETCCGDARPPLDCRLQLADS